MNYNIDLREAMQRRAERVAPVPADFAEQVAKAVRERRHKRAVRRWLWIGAAAVVAGIVVLIGSLPFGGQKGEEVVAQVAVSHPAPANEQLSVSLKEEAQKGQHVSSTPEERPLTVKPIEKPLTAHLSKSKSLAMPQRMKQAALHPEQENEGQVSNVQKNDAQVNDGLTENMDIAPELLAASLPSTPLPVMVSSSVTSTQPSFTPRELELMRQAELKRAQATMYIEEAIRVSQLLGDEETPPTRSV